MQGDLSRGELPTSPPPLFDPERGQTIREPEAPGPGYWVGAPSVVWDDERQRYLLTYRRRRPRGVEPDRGYAVYVAESRDGLRFEDVWALPKGALGTTSIERCCLARERGGPYRLYVSYVDPADGRWRIDVLEADRPDRLDPATARPALAAAGTGTEGVKDPWVFRLGGLWHMLVSYAALQPPPGADLARLHASRDAFNTGLVLSATGLALSEDGLSWAWAGEALGVGEPARWDAYAARLGCVVYRAPLWIGYYDGSADVGGNYEERCGLAYSHDLRRWQRTTTAGPALTSPHGSGSLRYVDALEREGALRFYYEYARPDGSHELRHSVVAL